MTANSACECDRLSALPGSAAKDGEGQSGAGWTAGLMGGSLGWAISSATSLRASPSDANIAQQPRPGILLLLPYNVIPTALHAPDSTSLFIGMLVLGSLL